MDDEEDDGKASAADSEDGTRLEDPVAENLAEDGCRLGDGWLCFCWYSNSFLLAAANFSLRSAAEVIVGFEL